MTTFTKLLAEDPIHADAAHNLIHHAFYYNEPEPRTIRSRPWIPKKPKHNNEWPKTTRRFDRQCQPSKNKQIQYGYHWIINRLTQLGFDPNAARYKYWTIVTDAIPLDRMFSQKPNQYRDSDWPNLLPKLPIGHPNNIAYDIARDGREPHYRPLQLLFNIGLAWACFEKPLIEEHEETDWYPGHVQNKIWKKGRPYTNRPYSKHDKIYKRFPKRKFYDDETRHAQDHLWSRRISLYIIINLKLPLTQQELERYIHQIKLPTKFIYQADPVDPVQESMDQTVNDIPYEHRYTFQQLTNPFPYIKTPLYWVHPTLKDYSLTPTFMNPFPFLQPWYDFSINHYRTNLEEPLQFL
jgi:hypothetical protein